jgi:structure-specific recognition protein 1
MACFDFVPLQTQDFKIRYASISRLFILPKSSTPHTLVVIGLDPPIRKGQTYYSYLLCQFNNADELQLELNMSDELLAQKNEKVCAAAGML